MRRAKLISKIIFNNFNKAKKIKNIINLKVSQIHRRLELNYFPYSIDLEPTTRCNLKCSMCQVSSWDRRCEDLSLERFKYILEKIPTLVKIKLQGMGEPFLNKDFFKMTRYARTKGIEISTSTNGTLMEDGIIDEIISSGLAAVQISLDGLNDEIRKGSHKQEIIGNIEEFITKRGKKKIPAVSIWSVAMKKNIDEIIDIIKLCSKLHVDYITLQYYLSYWGKTEWRRTLESEQINDKDKVVQEILGKAVRLAKALKVKFNIYCGNRFTAKNFCPWPWRSFYITADGFITPCCILTDPRIFNFGNIFEKKLDEIWNGADYIRFREKVRSGNLPDFCRGCYSGL